MREVVVREGERVKERGCRPALFLPCCMHNDEGWGEEGVLTVFWDRSVSVLWVEY